MSKEYPAKSFRSGNSVAIRMPAALGIEPDQEWTVVKEDGRLIIEAKDKPKRKFNIEKVRGCAIGTGLRYIKPEERLFEERPLLWDDPEWRAKHMPGE
jgi:antitoxin VapB